MNGRIDDTGERDGQAEFEHELLMRRWQDSQEVKAEMNAVIDEMRAGQPDLLPEQTQ